MQWLERSKSCPQCRNKCSEKNIIRIYFNTTSLGDTTLNKDDPSKLIDKIDNLHLQIREKDIAMKKLKEKMHKAEDAVKQSE